VLAPAARRPWLKALVLAYPVATLFAIVVTANHFWLDAAGGVVVLGLGYLLGAAWDRRGPRRRTSTAPPAAPSERPDQPASAPPA
jgi:hypothetical protein